MAELLSDKKIVELRAGLKGLPPGPWETDGLRQDDTPDRHNEYELLDARGYRLCDTQNCDYRFAEIEIEYDEDGSYAWNAPARKLMEHIARCDPVSVGALLDALTVAEAACLDLEARLAAVKADRDLLLKSRRDFADKLATAEAALATVQESALREAAAIVRGEVYHHRYRTWVYMLPQPDGSRGNRGEDEWVTKHSDLLADAILALITPPAQDEQPLYAAPPAAPDHRREEELAGLERAANDKNMVMFVKDTRVYADRPVGSVRIDMHDVRSILALYDASIRALAKEG